MGSNIQIPLAWHDTGIVLACVAGVLALWLVAITIADWLELRQAKALRKARNKDA